MDKVKALIILISFFLFIFIITACSSKPELNNTAKSKISNNDESNIKYAQVVDTLDLEGNKTFSEVLKDPNSKIYYHNAYNKLINNDKIHFLETAIQTVEYNDIWDGGYKFVHGSNGGMITL